MQEDRTLTFSPIEMKQCEEGANFETAGNRGDMEGLPAMCIDTDEAQLHGVFNQKESGGVWITVTKCVEDETTECKTDAEINEYVGDLQFQALYADNYMDLDDYDRPLRSHIVSQQISHAQTDAGQPVSILGKLEDTESLVVHQMKFSVARFIESNWPF